MANTYSYIYLNINIAKPISMKAASILIINFILIFHVASQDTCQYEELKFLEIEPTWTHLLIDSTIIGYQHPDSRYNFNIQNGMNHYNFSHKSILKDNFIINVMRLNLDADLAGYLVEKIEVETGDLIWQKSIDLRNTEYREAPLDTRIEENKLIIRGSKCIVPDSILGPFSFSVGFRDAVFFKRVLDIDTGEEIEYFSADEKNDNVGNIKFRGNEFYNIFHDDHIEQIESDLKTTSGDFISRRIINNEGIIISREDTIITGKYNDRDWQKSNYAGGLRIRFDGNSYYHIQQFLPDEESTEDFAASIDQYDSEFNLIKSVNLREMVGYDFGTCYFIQLTDDRILILGDKEDTNFFTKQFLLLLDKDLNLIHYIDGEDLPNNPGRFKVLNNDKILISTALSSSLLRTEIYHYISTPQGGFESVNTMILEDSKRRGWVQDIQILENGDFLLLIYTECLIDESFQESYNEWVRIPSSNFDLPTSNSFVSYNEIDISMSPNPSNGTIEIVILSEYREDILLQISDISGKILNRTQKPITSGENRINLDLDYTSGIYFLSIISPNFQKTQKILLK